MVKKHYIIMTDGSAYLPMYESMLKDVSGREDVTVLVDTPRKSPCKEFLLKNKVQKLTCGYLDRLGYEKNRLFECLTTICPSSEQVYVIFLNAALCYNPYLAGTLRRYKKRWKNVRYVLFYLDIIGAGVSRNADQLRQKGVFDLIYSYDADNAADYGLLQWTTFYSESAGCKDISAASHLYFCCGVTASRIPVLADCLEQCRNNGITCKMDLVCNEPAQTLQKYAPMANLLPAGHTLNYAQVLERELSARCMLEIVQPGRNGLTLRPYEAVVYNRKLLTNCKSILDFPYYNPAYMQYFEKVQDIDWQWVKDETPVDYDYKGNFSPALLLEDIKRRLG